MKNNNKMLKKFDIFIFDWDGTLNNLRTALKINEGAKRMLGLWNKDSSIKDFKRVDYNLKNKLYNEERVNNYIVGIFDLLFTFSKPKLQKDTIQLLKALKKKQKYVAIFSNARSYRLLKELDYLGVRQYFDVIVSARDLHTMKPNPTGLKAILYEIGAKPQNAVFIGDMVDDMISGKLAHIHTCAIADGFDSYQKLKSINPDYIFNTIDDLKNAL